MKHFNPEVGKVWQRFGRLEPAPIAEVPNLPYLPYLFLACTPARPRIYACAHRARCITLGREGREVGNRRESISLQPSEPLPNLGEVGNYE